MLRVVRVLSEGGYYLGPYWLTLPPNAFRWLPAVVNPLGFAASGWAIVRAHRAFGMTLLVPWMLLVCVPPAIMLLLIFGDGQSLPLTAPIVGIVDAVAATVRANWRRTRSPSKATLTAKSRIVGPNLCRIPPCRRAHAGWRSCSASSTASRS
jgi:hypothetical protein